jgi:hypothetical protein
MPGKCLPGTRAIETGRSCKNGGFCFRGADNSFVEAGDIRPLCNLSQHREFQHRSPAGLERVKASAIAVEGASCQAAEAGLASAVAASSNAVEMSRMLTTPIRL